MSTKEARIKFTEIIVSLDGEEVKNHHIVEKVRKKKKTKSKKK